MERATDAAAPQGKKKNRHPIIPFVSVDQLHDLWDVIAAQYPVGAPAGEIITFPPAWLPYPNGLLDDSEVPDPILPP